MSTHPRLVLIMFAMIMSAAWLQAVETVADRSELVIGLLVPPEEPEAASLRDGATLAVELANQSAGPRARMIIRGRNGQWGADGVEAGWMATDDGAQGLIAPPDGAASHLVLQVSGRTGVPVVSLCADTSVTQTGVPWMVRIVPSTVEEAKTLFTHLRAGHWDIVIPEGRGGRETANDLHKAARASGGSIEKTIVLTSSVTNHARFARQMLTHHPDAILLWLDPATAGKLAKELRSAGHTGILAGPGRLRAADFQAAAGDAREGLFLPGIILDEAASAAAQHFAVDFHKRFGREPDETAAASHDAAALLIHILKHTGDRPAHEAFPINHPFTGASGNLIFDRQGNRKANLQLLVARGGRFVAADCKPTKNESMARQN